VEPQPTPPQAPATVQPGTLRLGQIAGIEITVRSGMTVTIGPEAYDVSIWVMAVHNAEEISHRTWKESIPR